MRERQKDIWGGGGGGGDGGDAERRTDKRQGGRCTGSYRQNRYRTIKTTV